MSLYDKLTANEISMMDNYVKEYASYNHCEMKHLLRFWDISKSNYLYKLLGEQFIISKEYEYKQPRERMIENLERLFNSRTSDTYRFKKEFDRFLWENRIALGDCYYKLIAMTEIENLLDTSYPGDDFEINLPENKHMKVQKGARPMRIISRLAKAYNCFENLDGFQTEISQVLNQKKLRGEIVLSIHPLDYMTMSDNNSDWSSCMSWQEEGCYRRGTVEMMNSASVLVAYLRGAEDMSIPGGYKWNNKKWRELFIVTPEIITGVKGYPYQNSELVKTINSWLKELAEENLGWHYDNRSANTKYPYDCHFSITNDNNEVVDLSYCFETNTMYNDFGTTEHYGIFGADTKGRHYHNYSGVEVCMCCGSTGGWYESEGALVCNDCEGDYYTCTKCDERLNEDEVFWLDGEAYCENCYDYYGKEDSLTGEVHHMNNLVNVYLLKNEDEAKELAKDFYRKRTTYPSIDVYNTSGWAWNRYFNKTCRCYRDTYFSFHYVIPEDIKDNEVYDLFDVDENDYVVAD